MEANTSFSTITIDNQQDATNLIYLLNQLYIFRAMFSSIIRSTVTTASGKVHRCCWLVLSIGWNSVEPNTQHQPAATSVDITGSYSYSDMLLMMVENIA